MATPSQIIELIEHLDRLVSELYDLVYEEILERLLALNLERASH